MIDVESLVVDHLFADGDLMRILKVSERYWKIHVVYVPIDQSKEFPFIRVAPLNNADSRFSDNKATASSVPVQIDIWEHESKPTFPIEKEIDRIMKSLGFGRSHVAYLHEENEQRVRAVMRLENIISLRKDESNG